MAQRLELEADFQKYEAMLTLPAYWSWTDAQFGEEFKRAHSTIALWRKRANWEWIRDERRKHFAMPISEVDLAMLREAKRGSVPAATLMYERFDGYVHTQRQEQLHQLDEKDLDDELRRLMDTKQAVAQALAPA